MSNTKISVTLGKQLFFFSSHREWADKAQTLFSHCGHRPDQIVCIDSAGRLCKIGVDFRRAYEELAFPVTAYLYRPE